MDNVREFSVPPAQLSCLIGNLFAELEPPCSEPDDPEALTLCGKLCFSSTGSIAFLWATQRTWTRRKTASVQTGGAGVAEKEYVLGNKAKDLCQFVRQVTKPGPDDKVDAKDVTNVMRTIARAKTIEEMRDTLNATADRLDNRRKRPFFPKSETFFRQH